VIGIDDYQGKVPNLHSAVADAGDMVAALAAFGVPANQVLELEDRQADGAAIRAAVGWLVAHSTSATTAVLFYAGHVEKLAPTLARDNLLVMNMCGRGDKDIFAVAQHLGMKM